MKKSLEVKVRTILLRRINLGPFESLQSSFYSTNHSRPMNPGQWINLWQTHSSPQLAAMCPLTSQLLSLEEKTETWLSSMCSDQLRHSLVWDFSQHSQGSCSPLSCDPWRKEMSGEKGKRCRYSFPAKLLPPAWRRKLSNLALIVCPLFLLRLQCYIMK